MDVLVTLLVYAFLFWLIYLVVSAIMTNMNTPAPTQGIVKAIVLFIALLFLLSWLGGFDWPTIKNQKQMNLLLALILLALLSSCSSMRQRTVVVSVYEYPISDTVRLSKDSAVVVSPGVARELKKQEGRKNFWKGTTVMLVLVLLADIMWR